MNTPSGWLGWARQIAMIRYETGVPIFQPAHAQYVDEHPGMLVETLRSLRTPVPEHTVDLAEATRVVGVQEGTRELPPVDHWGAPAPEDVPVKDQGEPEAKRPPPVCILGGSRGLYYRPARCTAEV